MNNTEVIEKRIIEEEKFEDVNLYIYAKKNNLFLTVTDITGAERIFSSSGGLYTKQGREKRSQKIALIGWEKMQENLLEKKIKNITIFIRNKGGVYSKQKTLGLKTLLKNLPTNDFNIKEIVNNTPIAHGEIRKKGGRRGRRV